MSLDQFSTMLQNAGEALEGTYADSVETLGEYGATIALGVTAAVGVGTTLAWAYNRKFNLAQTPTGAPVSTIGSESASSHEAQENIENRGRSNSVLVDGQPLEHEASDSDIDENYQSKADGDVSQEASTTNKSDRLRPRLGRTSGSSSNSSD